jgi:hypothetical protein
MESRINTNEVNFIHPNTAKKDIELFGFEDAQNVFHIEDCWTLAHVMHVAGIFSSISQARKNGWNKPIPNGFSEFTVSKTKKKVWILNKIKD